MTEKVISLNAGAGIWAPLTNVQLASSIVERSMNRSPNLPGLVALYGPSGWGKSMAAAYVANRHKGIYVECRSFFTPKALMLAILKEMGIRPARTMHEMLDQITDQLSLSGRPLIIDEMDHIVEKNAIEVVRDIYEASHGTVLLIGEEHFPRKLQRWERFHNRVLVWQPAAAATMADAKKLAAFYARGLDIADDLLELLVERARGSVRRICVNIDAIREHCATQGLKRIDRAAWGGRELYTGEAPVRRIP